MPRLVILLLLSLLLPATAGAAVTLKIATLAPDGTRWMQAMREGAEQVGQRTEGRVQIRFYPGGVMGNDSSVLRKIRAGQLHGAAFTGGGLYAIYPNSQLYSLPFLFQSDAEVDHVRRHMDPLLREGLEQNGFVSFGISEGGFAYLMSDRPLSRVEELRGQKVWAPEGDAVTRRVFEAIGVAPIPLPLTDVHTGLQTGLVNTVGTSPVGAIALQWHTGVKYLTETPLLYLYGALLIEKKAFERLAPADQQTLRETLEAAFGRINEQSRRDNAEALQALRQQGLRFTQPAEADLARWRDLVKQAVDAMADEGLYSRDMLERLRQHLADFRCAQGTSPTEALSHCRK